MCARGPRPHCTAGRSCSRLRRVATLLLRNLEFFAHFGVAKCAPHHGTISSTAPMKHTFMRVFEREVRTELLARVAYTPWKK